MMLKKAVEIVELNIKEFPPQANQDVKEALRLETEAAKRILRQRLLTIPVNQPLLPGESLI